MSITGGPDISENGLVLYLDAGNRRSYPGSGTTWNDLSGNNNSGSLTNGPTFDSGNGGSIVFDGSNDDVLTNYNIALGNFTACVWFKALTTLTNYERLLDKSYTNGFWIGRNSTNANSWGGGVRESGAPYGRYITLTDNQWHYIVSIRNGTTHTIYGDGVDNTTSGTVSNSALDTTALTVASERPAATYTDCNIAIVQLYNRALSATEVLQNYNATRSRFGV